MRNYYDHCQISVFTLAIDHDNEEGSEDINIHMWDQYFLRKV